MKKTLSHEMGLNEEDSPSVHLHEGIAPVAWIIVCGEGLHNLIDGLSIGAAFSETFIKGVSLSLAIICEEFPHKLGKLTLRNFYQVFFQVSIKRPCFNNSSKKGDFAVLLASGMSFKVAICTNFLTSSFIYIGVIVGILVGENLDANKWIYAVAGGMFAYIAICDMVRG